MAGNQLLPKLSEVQGKDDFLNELLADTGMAPAVAQPAPLVSPTLIPPLASPPAIVPAPALTLGAPLTSPRPAAVPTQRTLQNVVQRPQTPMVGGNTPSPRAAGKLPTAMGVQQPVSPRAAGKLATAMGVNYTPIQQSAVKLPPTTPLTAVVGGGTTPLFAPINPAPVSPIIPGLNSPALARSSPNLAILGGASPIIPGSLNSPAMARPSQLNVAKRNELHDLLAEYNAENEDGPTPTMSESVLYDEDDDEDENIFPEDDTSVSSLLIPVKKRKGKKTVEVDVGESAVVTPKKGRRKSKVKVDPAKVDVVSVKSPKGKSPKAKVITPEPKRGRKKAVVEVEKDEVVVVSPKKGRRKSVDVKVKDAEVSIIKTPSPSAKKAPSPKRRKKVPVEEEEEDVLAALVPKGRKKAPAKPRKHTAKTDDEESEEEEEEAPKRAQSAKPRRKKKAEKAERDSQEYMEVSQTLIAHAPKGKGKWKALIPLTYNERKAEKKIELYGRAPNAAGYNPKNNKDGSESDDNPAVNQYMHYRELGAILGHTKFAFSASETGAGKTYITGRIYATMRNSKRQEKPYDPPITKMLVIGPASSIIAWNDLSANYNVPNIEFISYNSLSSIEGSDPKHPYLIRVDEPNEDGTKTKTHFEITQQFENAMNEGLLLVFDEAHRAKSNGAQSKACRALSGAVIEGGGYSRVLFLTATPFDKKKQAAMFFKAFGIFTSTKLYVTYEGQKMWKNNGIGQIAKKCATLDRDETENIIRAYKLNTNKPRLTGNTSEDIVYSFYKNIITKHLVRSIRKPKLPPALEPMFRNLFLHLTKQEETEYLRATAKLAIESANNNRGIPATILVAIERSKVEALSRLIRWYIDTYRKVKLIVYQNYVNDSKKHQGNLKFLIEQFQDVKHVVYTGSLDSEKREQAVYDFNNDDDTLIFFGSTSSGKESLNLHELRDPNRSRVMLISPSFHFTDSIQAAGRVNRRGMVSKPYIFFTYGCVNGQPHGMELKYLDTNARKTAVMKGAIQEEVAKDAVFPGDYDSLLDNGNANAKTFNDRFAYSPWKVTSS